MEFLDDYEAQVGWESDGVQSLREQDRVSDADLQVWREWAAAVTEVTVRRAGRSRSPRRVSGDDVSLMGGDKLRPQPKRRSSGASDSRGPRRRRAGAEPGSAAGGAGRERSARPSVRRGGGVDERCDLPRTRRPAVSRGPRETREVRHLVPPRVSGPMTVMEASAWWMRLIGLRNGFDNDATCVLPRDGHEDRLREIRAVPVQDVMTVVMALLRVVTMLQVECAQLIMQHGEFSQEVEVEVDDDETMWMQRGLKRSSRVLLQGEEPSPDLLADEGEQREETNRQREIHRAQEEDRARQEMEQRRLDEEQYAEQVRADATRPQLRTCLIVEHGGAAEGLTASLPLEEGADIGVQLRFTVVTLRASGGVPMSVRPTMPVLSSVVTGGDSSGAGGDYHAVLYNRWQQGELSDEAVQGLVGEEMYAVFVAQRMEERAGRQHGGFGSTLVEVRESGETEADTQDAT